MANVINRTTKEYLESVNTSKYSADKWIINPILPDCDSSEWVIDGDNVRETTQKEKDAKIAADKAANLKELKDKEDAETLNVANVNTAKTKFDALTTKNKLEFLYNRGV